MLPAHYARPPASLGCRPRCSRQLCRALAASVLWGTGAPESFSRALCCQPTLRDRYHPGGRNRGQVSHLPHSDGQSQTPPAASQRSRSWSYRAPHTCSGDSILTSLSCLSSCSLSPASKIAAFQIHHVYPKLSGSVLRATQTTVTGTGWGGTATRPRCSEAHTPLVQGWAGKADAASGGQGLRGGSWRQGRRRGVQRYVVVLAL